MPAPLFRGFDKRESTNFYLVSTVASKQTFHGASFADICHQPSQTAGADRPFFFGTYSEPSGRGLMIGTYSVGTLIVSFGFCTQTTDL